MGGNLGGGRHFLRAGTAVVLPPRGGGGGLAGEAGTHSTPCPQYLQNATDRKQFVHTWGPSAQVWNQWPVVQQCSVPPTELLPTSVTGV